MTDRENDWRAAPVPTSDPKQERAIRRRAVDEAETIIADLRGRLAAGNAEIERLRGERADVVAMLPTIETLERIPLRQVIERFFIPIDGADGHNERIDRLQADNAKLAAEVRAWRAENDALYKPLGVHDGMLTDIVKARATTDQSGALERATPTP